MTYSEEAIRQRAKETEARLLAEIRRKRGLMRFVDMLTPYAGVVAALLILVFVWAIH